MRNALIVDDSRWVHSLVRAQLGNEYAIESAYDGSSGLALAGTIDPEFILLDIDLPDIHGYEVCRRLKATDATRNVPVIFLTAFHQVDARVAGLNSGACDYITKPFEPWELAARVHAIIREKQSAKESASAMVIDPVTGLFNPRYLEARVDAEIARARRAGHSLACLIVKNEFHLPNAEAASETAFEKIMGHIAQAVRLACRREDLICRYAADSIAILAIARDRTAANTLAERVHDYIKETESSAHLPAIKVSIGVGISRLSTGIAIVHEALDALANARHSVFGKIVVGSEIVQLQLAG